MKLTVTVAVVIVVLVGLWTTGRPQAQGRPLPPCSSSVTRWLDQQARSSRLPPCMASGYELQYRTSSPTWRRRLTH